MATYIRGIHLIALLSPVAPFPAGLIRAMGLMIFS
jgi:hypothetical protein